MGVAYLCLLYDTNNRYTKIKKGTTQIIYLYIAITLKLQQLTTIPNYIFYISNAIKSNFNLILIHNFYIFYVDDF